MKNFLFISIFVILFLRINPVLSLEDREVLFKDALSASSIGQFEISLDKWNQYLKKFPNDAAALSNRGNVKLVAGDPKGAINDQNNAIALDGDQLDPYINRGIAEESLGLWLEAKEDYSFVISRDKDNFSAMYNLANVEGSLKNWENARKLYDHAAKTNPGFAMARSSLALADYELGNLNTSEQELRKLIRRYPTFVDARAALTALTWSKGNYGEAESNWVAVIELDPRYAEEDWLLEVRRWPPTPVRDLMKFIALK